MPITALGLIIALFALAGVPPLSGFWSKLMLFGSALDASSAIWWAPWLAIAGVLTVHYLLLTMVGLQERCTLKEKLKRELQNQNLLLL